MDLFHALSDEDGKLSGLARKLAQITLDDVDFVMNASIGELAERVGVSPPTVTRFCRRLGCKGFPDFKVQLAKLTYVGLRYVKPEVPTETPDEVAKDIIAKAQNAMFQLHRQLDVSALETAARLLRGAAFIHAFGASGNSAMIVNELHNRLFRLGCRINALRSASTHVHPEADRTKKLLMHKEEIKRLVGKVEQRGYTLVPLNLHYKGGRVKVEIALAKGKAQHDKREAEKKRDWEREKGRLMRQKVSSNPKG